MTYESIVLAIDAPVARLTLNRPSKLNSFTESMHHELADALAALGSRQDVRVLVLTGAGRAFCAGQDLAEPQMSPSSPGFDMGATVERHYSPLVSSIRKLAFPVVAAVNGVAAGAGANLALACDVVVATASATFIQSFSRVGLIPDTGGTFFLPRLVGTARAIGLAFFGERVSASQAESWGLIWKCVPDEDFPGFVEKLAQELARGATRSLALTKEAMYASLGNDLAGQLALERDLMRELGKTADYGEGIRAFLGKRPAAFDGR